jgi:hypothetical protein
MRHTLSRFHWFVDMNETLKKRGYAHVLDFDEHFVLVENDWASGYEPEDVAEKIATGEHQHSERFQTTTADA